MADEFSSPAPRTPVPATEPVIDPVTGRTVVIEMDEPVVDVETTYAATPSDTYSASSPEPGSPSDSSTTGVAKEKAAEVGQEAADAGRHVAGVATEQVSEVASETATQAKNLYEQTRQELQGQAATQQQRLADSVRSLSSELESMADKGNAGPASELVREASSRTRDVAGWLDQRDPGALLQEVTAFARRRPGTFLAIAAGAGLIAGRLTRGAISEARSDSGSATASASGTSGTGTAPAPVAGSTGTPVPGYFPPTPAPVEPTPYEPYEETVPGRGYPNGQGGL